MRLHDLFLSTVGLAALGLILAAAPGRSQSTFQTPPAIPTPPAMPAMLAAPAAPLFPAEIAIPPVPAAPAAPAAPAVPALPWMESTERGSSRSRHHDGPASDCSDLHIEFRHEPAILETEERTLSKSDARVLRVSELENGGIQMQGWDKDVYSVTACKAADAARSDAKQLLSEIKLSVQGGQVSVTGPARHNDHNDWTVFLLIRTPRAAEVELKAHNGPVSLYKVDGKITARGTNGPISMADCTGEADISAVNGPISYSGTGGKLRLHTENGPISVALNGANWSGSGLVADAVNGPLTLSVPSGYQSSFLVESNGHSPISCHARVCDEARKTWDDQHRRIEYGSGTPVIRLSTENGPISVNAL
jgi:DUF4097 and DUF4098 domain-containing protein YvlB